MTLKKLRIFLASLVVIFGLSACGTNSQTEELFQKGLTAYNSKLFAEAKEYFIKAAGLGSVKSSYYLGFMYNMGFGVEKDNSEAFKWYKLSAEQGNEDAIIILKSPPLLEDFNKPKDLFWKGLRAYEQEDLSKAFKYYLLSSKQGFPIAQYSLACMYYSGLGVSKNFNEAIKWTRLAASQGDYHAQIALGDIYYDGMNGEFTDIAIDYQEAAKWYRLAAGEGVAHAQYRLGIMYKDGKGFNQNFIEAEKWFLLAAEQGNIKAITALESKKNVKDLSSDKKVEQPKLREISLKGTGLKMVLPQDIKPMPLGTYLTDELGEIIIQFLAGPAISNQEDNPANRKLFPDPPEKFQGGQISGNLYKRTRKEHGGKWDGWWMCIVRDEVMLNVQVMYIGNSDKKFESLKMFFSDLIWDEQQLDPELAFGASIKLPKSYTLSSAFGSLNYKKSGQNSNSKSNIMIQAVPVTSTQGKKIIPAVCGPGFAAAFHDHTYHGPHFLNENSIVFCDAWSTEKSGRNMYKAMLLMDNGAALSVTGTGDAEIFRKALLNISFTRPINE